MGDRSGATAPSDDAPQYPIASVGNALRLIQLFRDHAELRLSEAASELGVANSTAHRLLAMLAHHGFVVQNPRTRAYEAGSTLLDVGMAVVRSLDIRRLAVPVLDEAAQDFGETMHLGVLEGSSIRYLVAVESPKALRVASRLELVTPAHSTSLGKVLLAELDPGALRRLYPDDRWDAGAPNTIATYGRLVDELEQVRQRGYAVSSGESEDGVFAVGVAVRDPAGVAQAAISCAAPVSRFDATPSSIAATAVELHGYADRIGERVGHR